ATEAFLRTARRRISVRRHARLVDYWMHEGRNARAWITIETDADLLDVPLSDLKFAALDESNGRRGGVTSWDDLRKSTAAVIFEPVAFDERRKIDIRDAHSRIEFYTWAQKECCLPAGSTRATLRDVPFQPQDSGNERPDSEPRL